jgi:hypothetical protein
MEKTMTNEWLQEGQRVLAIPTLHKDYEKYGNSIMCLGEEIIMVDNIPYAKNCHYHDKTTDKMVEITMPLRLLWLIADDENLESIYFSQDK